MRLNRYKVIRIRIHNGAIIDFTYGINRLYDDEVSIPVKSNINRPLSICFETYPVHDNWILAFGIGEEYEIDWRYCRACFNYFGFIKTSLSQNDMNNDLLMELPRFTINPEYTYEVLGTDLRGSVGQPFGRTIRQLRTLEVNFARIKIEAIEDYFRKVSIHKPHFIVPYPKSVSILSPLWATLQGPPEYTKRNENGGYWNCSLTWKEAY